MQLYARPWRGAQGEGGGWSADRATDATADDQRRKKGVGARPASVIA